MTYSKEHAAEVLAAARRANGITPQNCPHCAYDRGFPETASGGWIYPGNNAPIVCCPLCNPDGAHPRQ